MLCGRIRNVARLWICVDQKVVNRWLCNYTTYYYRHISTRTHTSICIYTDIYFTQHICTCITAIEYFHCLENVSWINYQWLVCARFIRHHKYSCVASLLQVVTVKINNRCYVGINAIVLTYIYVLLFIIFSYMCSYRYYSCSCFLCVQLDFFRLTLNIVLQRRGVFSKAIYIKITRIFASLVSIPMICKK